MDVEPINKRCWICGGEANSEEHKFKASIIKSNFGKRYKDGNELLFIKGHNEVLLNSYKAKELKFSKIICIDCNNNKTKPHDNAYDIFIKYIEQNFYLFFDNKEIDFKLIFGIDWKKQKINLYRYFAKHAGCKIVSNAKQYAYNLKELSEFILGSSRVKSFKIHFQLKVGIKYFVDLNENNFPNLYNSPTIVFGSKKKILNYGGWLSHQWISSVWIVSNEINSTKLIDFDKQIEPIELFDFNFNEINNEMRYSDALRTVEHFGLNTTEECEALFKKIINDEIK